ncbi:MAG: hypothetical protein ACYTEZ_09185 [Planctomycetota bacterium]|jgi:hypothetical protein
MRALGVLLLASLAGCVNTDRRLQDLTWGQEIDGDYDQMVARARWVLEKQFPNGLDPDRTNEEEGDFWTVWDHKISVLYRKTQRRRAHLKVEDAGEGKVRIGVAVITQLNDNIDNPHSIEEARWVKTQRDQEWAKRIEDQIARRYLAAKPSEAWKEKHRETKRKTLRPDLVDRHQDVDLEEEDEVKDTKPLPPLRDDR